MDASTLVSAALKSGSIPEQALLNIVDRPNCLLVSQAVEDEYREVLLRPKFNRFASISHRLDVLQLVVVAADQVEPVENVRDCLDPKDDKYLSLALAVQAAMIVSSDKRHLLSMHPWRGISIISPATFLALHG